MVRILTILPLLLLFITPATAQSVESILKNTAEQHEKMMAEVDDMKLVIRPEGDFDAYDQMITYYKKLEVDGEPTFQTYTEFKGGLGEMNGPSSSAQPPHMMAMGKQMYEELKDVATYEGTETVDGEETHVLYVEDLSPFMEKMSEQQTGMKSDARMTDARIYIDADEWVMRKMSMLTEMRDGRNTRKMRTEMTMSDYRQVGPVYQPFSMKTVMENPMSEEQRAEIEQQREQIEAMMDKLPESQRGRMQKMLSALGGDEFVLEMVVEELKVNEGVPAEYFD